MRVYEAVGETLQRLGVRDVFALMGDGNLRFVTHMADALGISFYPSRHEGGAVAMADGYARVSGNVGVCSVTQGPGVTNALTALTEAQKAGTPLLLLAGDAPSRPVRHNQRIDQGAVFSALGVAVERVRSPETTVADVARAYRRAYAEQRPVAMSISVDIQEIACDDGPLASLEQPVRHRAVPAADEISAVADLVASSSRPAIVAGRGAVRSGARTTLAALGDRIGAILATTVQAKGFFAGDPFDVRVAGEFATPVAARLLGQADLVLAFGASLTHWTTMDRQLFARDVRIVQCVSDPAAVGALTRVDAGVVGDAAATAAALDAELERRGVGLQGFRTMPVHRELASLRLDGFEDRGDGRTIDPRTAMLRLDTMLPRERTIVGDSGHFQGWPVIYLSAYDGTDFVFSNDFQAVGLGLGTAFGAAVARRDRLAVAVVGDGGLAMSLGELETFVRSRLPLLVVVVNDSAYGAEVHFLGSLGREPEHALFREIDFAAIALAMGARGLTVRAAADLDALEPWLRDPQGTMVVDCKVDPRLRADWFGEAFGPTGWYVRMIRGGG